MPTCTYHAHGVRLSKLKSCTPVAEKMKALMTDMKEAAEEVMRIDGVAGATAGNLTPMYRFSDDMDVPSSTRYEVIQEPIDAKYGATNKKKDAMDAWAQEVGRINATLKKEGDAKAGTSTGETSTPKPEDADLGASQQTTVSRWYRCSAQVSE
jgi:hypothetical protein